MNFLPAQRLGSSRTSLYAMLEKTASAAIALQAPDGSMLAGHNGPYGDPERPARNTGHWLMTWVFAHRETGSASFLRAARSAADYLVHPEVRPGGFTVHHRDSPHKDHCNGLMGPAFTLEALALGGVYLDRDDLLDLARKLVDMHPYDARRHLWLVREVDGRVLGVDITLNHQIWFAAAASMVAAATGSTPDVNVIDFMDNLPKTMVLRRKGRIRHLAQDLGRNSSLRRLKKVLTSLRQPDGSAQDLKREIAYHFFSLYALTILRLNMPNLAFWHSREFEKVLRYGSDEEYTSASGDPDFVKPYAPPGFPLSFGERAWANQVFGPPDPKFQALMMTAQFSRGFDHGSGLLTKGSADPATQAARIYELTRLDDIVFEVA